MRDLQKDMETCQRATPEPWEIHRNDVGDEYACVVPTEIYDSDGFPVVSYEGGLAPDCNWKAETLEANANFITEAREGWPEAIIRAMEAEEKNAKLKKALELACIRLSAEFGAHPDGGRWEFWKELFMQEARIEHDQA